MSNRILASVLTGLLLTAAWNCHAQGPELAKPTKEHELLAQFAGEWNCTAETVPAPGQEPFKCEGTESAKMVGGLWLVSEGKASPGGMPVTSQLTVGYNVASKKYVGNFFCTADTTLWQYTGSMDDSGKKLTLLTEGPSPLDPTKRAKFRETLELKDKDLKTFTSEMQNEDGSWLTFVKMEYRRKK
ncbi:DUF1579 domain-containing protein [Anatilimnocola floriformis]|uniref:DUF1579 domain-containing protein n=1 Tax=Anatilimnocola floriformis TaxID=2948575 RepID=UPI0020C5395D|nr:DUF1579 domain-containing protein [Anatilimnocola floriformis]